MGINLKEVVKERIKEYEMKIRVTKKSVKRKKIIQQLNEYKSYL